MRGRAEAMHGQLTIQSTPSGTTVGLVVDVSRMARRNKT
jgi:signal transduction histidine kinase